MIHLCRMNVRDLAGVRGHAPTKKRGGLVRATLCIGVLSNLNILFKRVHFAKLILSSKKIDDKKYN